MTFIDADGKIHIQFVCDQNVYSFACEFFRAARLLHSQNSADGVFIATMVNACLALELFLKSICATRSWEHAPSLDEQTALIKDAPYPTITVSLKDHKLSALYAKIPVKYQEEIQAIATEQGVQGDILKLLEKYDHVFVKWRYGYETNLGPLASHPLIPILNAVKIFCDKYVGTPYQRA